MLISIVNQPHSKTPKHLGPVLRSTDRLAQRLSTQSMPGRESSSHNYANYNSIGPESASCKFSYKSTRIAQFGCEFLIKNAPARRILDQKLAPRGRALMGFPKGIEMLRYFCTQNASVGPARPFWTVSPSCNATIYSPNWHVVYKPNELRLR